MYFVMICLLKKIYFEYLGLFMKNKYMFNLLVKISVAVILLVNGKVILR